MGGILRDGCPPDLGGHEPCEAFGADLIIEFAQVVPGGKEQSP